MKSNLKVKFQQYHYLKDKPNFLLGSVLSFVEFFYKNAINFKNFLYEKNILKEEKVDAEVICVGNLTTGGVGKTPIVIALANDIAKVKKVAVISRGYGAKLSNKTPNIIKDYEGIKFENGLMCGDEPFQISKKVDSSVVVITCRNRKLASQIAIEKYGVQTIILDDGFSNRKIKKDRTILAIDSKMRFGNNCLLPKGPLREPVEQIKRANEIVVVNKGDNEFDNAIKWIEKFNKPIKVCNMIPKRIYNAQSGAEVKLNNEKAVAFCAIGQPDQFFNFARKFYDISEFVFEDHHKYTKSDIDNLIKFAQKNDISTFITTQKDEAKLKNLINGIQGYSFNILELEVVIE